MSALDEVLKQHKQKAFLSPLKEAFLFLNRKASVELVELRVKADALEQVLGDLNEIRKLYTGAHGHKDHWEMSSREVEKLDERIENIISKIKEDK